MFLLSTGRVNPCIFTSSAVSYIFVGPKWCSFMWMTSKPAISAQTVSDSFGPKSNNYFQCVFFFKIKGLARETKHGLPFQTSGAVHKVVLLWYECPCLSYFSKDKQANPFQSLTFFSEGMNFRLPNFSGSSHGSSNPIFSILAQQYEKGIFFF